MRQSYEILLVETSKKMRYMYKNMLSGNPYRFKITAETDNGAKAISYMGEHHYDLVFCDLELADGNGLSMIKKLRKLREDCRIVVISDCVDLESVRKAFKNGAYDFIPKSEVSLEKMGELLAELKDELDQSESRKEDWHKRLEHMLGLIRDQQRVNGQALLDLLEQPELKILDQEYQMVFFRMDNVVQVNLGLRNYDTLENLRGDVDDVFIEKYKKKIESRDELQKIAADCIEKIFLDIPEHCLIFTKKHSGLILLPILDDRALMGRIKYLRSKLSEVCFYSYSFTIGKIHCGKESFLQAYREIMNYHQWKFYAGDGCILNSFELDPFNSLPKSLDSCYYRICRSLVSYQLEDIHAALNEIYDVFEKNSVDILEVYDEMFKMIDRIEKYLGDKGISEPKRFYYYSEGIKESDTLSMMKREIDRIMSSLLDYIMKQNINQYSKKVNEIIRFIERNLDQHITLKMITEITKYSEIHTSRIFKKEVGVGIVQYINEKKMAKAKELLENTGLKIKEIALAVGIEDQLYFNKQFHKMFEMSPSCYRKEFKESHSINK